MSRIVLVTGVFPVYDRRGVKIREEFGTSHGIDEDTGRVVITSCDHPAHLGAKFDPEINEWVLEE
jgi:hypothetical protein